MAEVDITELKFPVQEYFNSIQGEGFWLGSAATFIRLHGCNLSCPWCDTKESWHTNEIGASKVKWMYAEEILKICDVEQVVITGGEPCIHPRLHTLVRYLQLNGHYVCIETNGTLPTPEADWVTVSPKPESNYSIHARCKANELKFVVSDELNFDRDVLPWLLLEETEYTTVWLQPEGGDMQQSAERAFEFIAKHPNRNLRLGVQIHKIFNLR